MDKKKKITIAVVAVAIIIAIAIIVFLLTKNTNTVYTISFNTNGGNEVVSQKVEEGEKVTKPSDPTKEGYEFLGWYLNGVYFDFQAEVEDNLTLDAKWKEILVEDDKNDDKEEDPKEEDEVTKYTVKFDSDEGSKVANQTVEKNKKATKPSDPKKEGYIFKGWYLGSTKYNFSNKVTKNITLKAKWDKVVEQQPEEEKPNTQPEEEKPNTQPEEEKPNTQPEEVKQYTVKFEVDGKIVTTTTVKEGEKVVEKPSNPTKDGYTFKYWSLNGAEYKFSNTVTQDITLKAEWNKNKEISWTYEEIEGSYARQVRIFVTEDGNKVAGTVDITYTNGVTETTNIPASGYLIPKNIYSSISNPKVK